jgi:NADH-quinone oxidoreductase subunit N
MMQAEQGAQQVAQVYQIYRILPEVALTVTGVLIMLIEPLLPRGASRKPLGGLAILGTLAALIASLWQLGLPAGTAYRGEIQTDAFSAFFHILITGIVLVSLLTAVDVFRPDTENTAEFYALTVFGAVGMCLMTSAVELLLIFISLEISSISTYILAGFRRHTGKSTEAALKYFLLGSFATAFFLFGIALLFGSTGTTEIAAIAARLPGTATPGFAVIAIAMVLIGLGFKVSAAPFHVWTPDVYEGAPSPVVGLMSTAPKAAAFAVLLRIAFGACPWLHSHWMPLVWLLAAISMTVGNLGALRQHNVKRMLAYSSIAHAGYLLVAFTALSREGIAAAIFYTAAYAVTNVGIFAIISHVGGYDEKLVSITDYRGLARSFPLMGGVLAFFLFSLIGIPFTAGFFGKFYVFSAALSSGVLWLSILGLVNSGVAAYYYLRLVTTVYSSPAGERPAIARPGWTLQLALFLTIAATLMLGIFPDRTLAVARAGAATYNSNWMSGAPSPNSGQ